jgi:hypothetical protein
MKALRHVLAIVLLLVAGLVATGSPAFAASYGPYEIKPWGYPFCAFGDGTANSTPVRIRTCPPSPNTRYQWDFIDTTNGYYRIKNRSTGKCMNVQGAVTYPTAAIIQYTCGGSGTLNDQWLPVFAAKHNTDFYFLRNRKSNLCLHMPAATSSVQLIQETCRDGIYRDHWTWVRPPGV